MRHQNLHLWGENYWGLICGINILHRPKRPNIKLLTGQFSDYTAILRYIVQKLGGKPPENAIKTLAECCYSAGAAHLRRIEPQILSMLNKITTSGVRLGLISNTEGTAVLDWANSPLSGFFEVTVFSNVVGFPERCQK